MPSTPGIQGTLEPLHQENYQKLPTTLPGKKNRCSPWEDEDLLGTALSSRTLLVNKRHRRQLSLQFVKKLNKTTTTATTNPSLVWKSRPCLLHYYRPDLMRDLSRRIKKVSCWNQSLKKTVNPCCTLSFAQIHVWNLGLFSYRAGRTWYRKVVYPLVVACLSR